MLLVALISSILKSEDDEETSETVDSPILKEEGQKAVRMLKDGKSLSVDNLPAEILKHGGPGITNNLNRRMSENLDQWTMNGPKTGQGQ